ncbi:MAG: hypothetical protein ABEJ69_01400 [Candidatus Nanohaloarchaea archaeon]
MKTVVEIYYDNSGDSLGLKGDPNNEIYEKIKDHLTAIEHNMNNGIQSTLYRVDEEVDEEALRDMVDAAPEHTDHGVEEGARRGLEIQPGTPTEEEVDELRERVKQKAGVDLAGKTPSNTPMSHVWNDLPDDANDQGPRDIVEDGGPGAGGGNTRHGSGPDRDLVTMLKEDYPSIGEGKWRCTHPDHDSPELNERGEKCSLGHSHKIEENEYVQKHRQPFDITTPMENA